MNYINAVYLRVHKREILINKFQKQSIIEFKTIRTQTTHSITDS